VGVLFCDTVWFVGLCCNADAVGSSTAFWLYGVACFVAVAFIAAFVPETKDRRLEEDTPIATGLLLGAGDGR